MIKVASLNHWFILQYIRFTLYGAILLFTVLQLYIFLSEEPVLDTAASLVVVAVTAIIFLMMSLYTGIRSGTIMRQRLDEMNAFVARLSSGKTGEVLHIKDADDLSVLERSLNELSVNMSEQARSLQRISSERLTLEKQAQQAAVIEERQRLARDLHDSVSQQLFAMTMMSSASVRMLDTDHSQAKQLIHQAAEIAEKAQGEMRALLLHLRPVDLKGESLSTGLEKLANELEQKTPITFSMNLQHMNKIPESSDEHLFRVVQEAVSNILRHANATVITIRSELKGTFFQLFIGDNGTGFDVNEKKWTSYGLQTMKERCEEIGGQFELRSKEGEGTYITIRIAVTEGGE
ncbi:histidine kinase [Jeotgalibacillus alimentarius]|uniref:histidine kinase n=1 Tax=Jeotgalibacillus alimentarius TaxID=135826 RepID=A0A0C2W0J1_9BACL|nr:sensor histidine kinase [Jeotgalibacillus alimentarius]KIL50136.1 histidine kinase [Jeotgalibacillus alimentarius]